jgi:hypothetical protein
MSIVKLSLPFSPAAVEDLRQRLRATRWPDEIAGSDWEYGFSLQFLQELCEYRALQTLEMQSGDTSAILLASTSK